MDLYEIRQKLILGTPLTELPLRVTDYSRVSTDHIAQRNSLKNQKEHFDEMIQSNKNWTYIEGYVDDGISGTTDIKRTDFMRMIDDARKGLFDLIITKEISRFSRNTLDSIKYTRELLSYGVAVLFINDNINTAMPDSELRLTIMSSMAQDEIRRLSERVKFGMNRAIINGKILGNDMLFGYKKDKLMGNLIVIESQAKVVRDIFNWYGIEEDSLQKIADRLNQKKIKTSFGYNWSSTAISRIIRNPKYMGYYCGRKSEVIDYITKKVKIIPKEEWILYENHLKIPQIVDINIWNKANERLRNKSVSRNIKKYPFTSKIICKNHNTVFHRRKQCKIGTEISWICAKHLESKTNICPNIRQSELDKIITEMLDLNEIMEIAKSLLIKTYQENVINSKNLLKESYEQNIKKLLLKKGKLLELNMEEKLSKEEFYIENNKCNVEIKALRKKLSTITTHNQNINYSKIEKDIEKVGCEKEIKESVITQLLDRMEVSGVFDNAQIDMYIKVLTSKYDNMKIFEFKRGYDRKSTKRYIMRYKVNVKNIGNLEYDNILLKIARDINKNLYINNHIPYSIYKRVDQSIIGKLKKYNTKM